LAVTLDLPTPPFPDAISSGRVRELGVLRSRRGGGVAVEAAAQGLSLVVGHHGEVHRHAGDAVDREHGGVDPMGDLVAQRAAGDREGDEDLDRAVVGDLDLAHHVQVDDRSVQFRVLHRAQGLDDLVRRYRHRALSGEFALSP
jgi:hypothetical protein